MEDVGNSELITGLSELVQESNVLTGRLLAHLVELEQRMLHLELGYPSLFSYCVEALRMSEGTRRRFLSPMFEHKSVGCRQASRLP